MSNCKSVCKYFSDYVDGEISESLKKEVDEHIAVCQECAEKLKKARYIREYMRKFTRLETSEKFDFILREKICQEFSRKKSFLENCKESIDYLPAKSYVGFATVAVFAIIFIIININNSNDKKVQINDTVKEEGFTPSVPGVNQNIMSGKMNRPFLKGESISSINPPGVNDSTIEEFKENQNPKSIDDKIMYIKKDGN